MTRFFIRIILTLMALMKCSNCGNDKSTHAGMCPSCGTVEPNADTISLIRCPDCRLKVSAQAQICPKCGYPTPGWSESQEQLRGNINRKNLGEILAGWISAFASVGIALGIVYGVIEIRDAQLLHTNILIADKLYPEIGFPLTKDVEVVFTDNTKTKLVVHPGIKNKGQLPVNISLMYWILSTCKQGKVKPLNGFFIEDPDVKIRVRKEMLETLKTVPLNNKEVWSLPPDSTLDASILFSIASSAKEYPELREKGLLTVAYRTQLPEHVKDMIGKEETPSYMNTVTYSYPNRRGENHPYRNCTDPIRTIWREHSVEIGE